MGNESRIAQVGRLLKGAEDELDRKCPVKQPAALVHAIEGGRKSRRMPELDAEAIKQMYHLLGLGFIERFNHLEYMRTVVAPQLEEVAKRHGVSSVGRVLGFRSDKAFMEWVAQRLLYARLQDDDLKEFASGSLGRQNAFMGDMFELPVKYGPLRDKLHGIGIAAVQKLNREVRASVEAGGLAMFDARGSRVTVKVAFRKPLKANLIKIDTPDGLKAATDLGAISFSETGHWTVGMPVEIKLPAAASGATTQFASFPERVAEAIKAGRKIEVHFDKDDFEAFRGSKTKADFDRFMSGHSVEGIEEIDGRSMVKLSMDPGKLLFADDSSDPLAHQRVLVRPDSRTWNPLKPDELPNSGQEKVFEIGRWNGRAVSVEVGASSKGGGFAYWKIMVPVERRFLTDVYRGLFSGM